MAEGELAAATQQLAKFPKHGWTVGYKLEI
jgi:hypothetical protein